MSLGRAGYMCRSSLENRFYRVEYIDSGEKCAAESIR
jgi:hypothetical protein